MFTEADIKPHMEVIDTQGRHVGTVDHVEGGQIKLTKQDSADGQHHYVQAGEVDHVENGRLVLRGTAAEILGTVEAHNMSEAEVAAASEYHATTTSSPLTGAANRPYFGTSGTGTGMGGSGAGEN